VRAGYVVEVFERSAGELDGRGAGIITPRPVFEQMTARNLVPPDFPRRDVRTVRYVSTGGRLGDVDVSYATTSWAHLYRFLRRQVPSAAYHHGVTVQAAAGAPGFLETSRGRIGPYDLVVFADGYRSLGRSTIDPEPTLEYRGLVFWRGLISSQQARDVAVPGAITRIVYPDGHGVVYEVPADDATVGESMTMWGYYLPVSADLLTDLLVDVDGRHHRGSVSPRKVRPDVDRRLAAQLADRIPRPYLDLIERTANTSLQAVYSVRTTRYYRDRICVVGDAGTLLPPYSGSGVLKAMANATTLGVTLATVADIDQALSDWETQQFRTVDMMSAVAERIGTNLIYHIPELTTIDASTVEKWLSNIHPGETVHLP
jgi:2-polyprenyl-6-methoxyphenol hydroxylase-like FAD-dependent oxidoreductase